MDNNPRTEVSATLLNVLSSVFTALPLPNSFEILSLPFPVAVEGDLVFCWDLEVNDLTNEGGTPKLLATGVIIFPKIGVNACPPGIPLTT